MYYTVENKENINSNINIPKTQRQINSEIYKNLRDNVPEEHKHKIMSVYNDILESNKLMKELPTDWDEEKHKKERKSYYSKFQNFITPFLISNAHFI